MPIVRLSRPCLFVSLVCATIPTLFVVLIASSRWDSLFWLLPLRPKFDTHVASGNVYNSSNYTSSVSVEHDSFGSPSFPLSITESVQNNNAVYPRLHIQTTREERVETAKKQLIRLESVRHLLFDGEDLNRDMMKRLQNYLRRAEFEEDYTPPRVCADHRRWCIF